MKLTVGIDIGGTNTKIGIVKQDGTVLVRGEIPTRFRQGPEDLAGRVKKWLEGEGDFISRISWAGMGCAGLVDGQRGILFYSPNMPGWEDISLAEIFSGIVEIPVVVENDVNAAAYAEFKAGSGKGMKNFICLTMGTGLGGGIISDGRLLRGHSGFAGEAGHTVIDVNGPECSCGQRGCLEEFVKADAIVGRIRKKLGEGRESTLKDQDSISVKQIAEAAGGGDTLSVEALRETGRYLGIGLSNLAHLFNPEAIAVGGGVSQAGDLILQPARVTFKEHVMIDILGETPIIPAELGNDASFLGGALLAMDKFMP